jgi:hypothetical protein
MFSSVAGIVAACLATCVGAVVAQSSAPITIVGQVVSAVTGAPLGGAVVNLSSAAQPSVERTARTGEDGRFVFDGVSPGKYYMYASKSGFFIAGLNDDGHHGLSDELVVGWPGPPLVTMKLLPHGGVAGTVVDDAGKPVGGARVTALVRQRAWRSWGQRLWWTPAPEVKTPVTDDGGHYSIEAVDPGDYLIEVEASAIAVPGQVQKTFGTTYSPGVHSISRAIPIALGVGEQRVVDIRLEPIPVFDVSGVVDVPTANPISAFVQLFSIEDATERQRPEIEQVSQEIEQVSQTGLSFKFPRLPPGEYLLEANVGDRFWGEQRFTIDDRSVTDVHIVLVPPFVASGRVIWEGAARPPDRSTLRRDVPVHYDFQPSAEDLAFFAKARAESPVGLVGMVPVGIVAIRNQLFRFSGVTWSADGTFTLRAFPGRFLAEDARLNGWFLKSFRINGREALDEPVEINSNPSGAVLTLTRAMGEVRGNIVTAAGVPDRGSMALMFSTNSRVWPGVYGARGQHLLMVGGDGTDRFTFSDVLPGEYYLTAIAPMPWDRLTEDMLRGLAVSAVRVQVLPNASIVRTLTRAR